MDVYNTHFCNRHKKDNDIFHDEFYTKDDIVEAYSRYVATIVKRYAQETSVLGTPLNQFVAVVILTSSQGWEIANDSPLAVLDAIPPAGFGDVRTLVRRVVASGRAWVAPTLFEGRDVVRICATNGETGTKDVNALIAALNDGT